MADVQLRLELSSGLFQTKRTDAACRELADRHYSRQRRGHREFIGPCEPFVLRNDAGTILFVWTRPKVRLDKQKGYNCAIFRNESARQSSDIILEAERLVFQHWGRNRLYTYVKPDKIHSSNPGYCFKVAGWNHVGESTKGHHLLVKYEEYAKDND